jgi:hypothetical protein
VFSAVAFAEEGLHETARQLISESRQPKAAQGFGPADLESLGLRGFHLVYGYVSVEG